MNIEHNPYQVTQRRRDLHTASKHFFGYTSTLNPADQFVHWVQASPVKTYAEYGCGDAIALQETQARLPQFDVWGIDLYPVHVKHLQIREADFKKVHFVEGFLGSGMSVAAFGCYAENLMALEQHFRELHRVLAVNGKFIFSPIPAYQQRSKKLHKTLFQVQNPLLGELGILTGTNSFPVPLLELASSAGFSASVIRESGNEIQGIELVKKKTSWLSYRKLFGGWKLKKSKH